MAGLHGWDTRRCNPRTLKVRYSCPTCSIHVWGKPKLQILCIPCGEQIAMTTLDNDDNVLMAVVLGFAVAFIWFFVTR